MEGLLSTGPTISSCSAPIEKSLDVSFYLAMPQKGHFGMFFEKCVSNVRSKSEKCEVLFMKGY